MRNERSAARGCEPEALWRERVADWSRSGETVADYCSGRGLNRWTFYDWRRKLKLRAGAPSGFVQVQVVKGGAEVPSPRATLTAEAKGSAGVEVVLAGGRRLRLERGFDPATLSAAVATLEGPAC
jgi:hypothetical protein